MKFFWRYPTVWIAFGLIGLIVLSRLLPHWPNVTPVLAVALFCGGFSSRMSLALLIPLSGMLLGDSLLGWHASMWAVYLAIALCVVLGRVMLSAPNLKNTLIGGLSGSVLFFILTNFAVWLQGDLYPLTGVGLMACYIAAIPFFHYTLLGTLGFGVCFLGAWKFLQQGQMIAPLPRYSRQ